MRPFLEIRRKLIVIRDFLEPELCATMCRRSRSAQRSAARVAIGQRRIEDITVRRTKRLTLSPRDRSHLRKRLLSLMPHLENWFAVRLSDLQRVQVLSYRRGDFYSRHSDSTGRPHAPAHIARRKVSLVLFMNRGNPQGRCRDYSGGDLNLYDVKDDGAGVKVFGEPGLLVAFRSATLHEVRPVRSGERLTAVAWVC